MRKQLKDEAILEAMIDQMIKSTKSAIAAIDDALAHIEQSDKRIEAMEAKHAARCEMEPSIKVINDDNVSLPGRKE